MNSGRYRLRISARSGSRSERCATTAPARILGYEGTVGTLQPGANADIALIERRNGNVDLTDSDGNTVTAKERRITRMTIKDGRVWYERPGE